MTNPIMLLFMEIGNLVVAAVFVLVLFWLILALAEMLRRNDGE